MWTASQTNTEGASDPNGNPLTYDAVDLPPGLSIDSTGFITGTVENGAAADFDGSYNPTIIVANQGGSTQRTFAWTTNQAQVAPTLTTTPSDQTNLTGDNVSLQISATQVDNDPITYDADNLPDGLDIDSDTGLISGTVAPDAATGTPYAITVTATDEATNLSTSQTFNWTIATNSAGGVAEWRTDKSPACQNGSVTSLFRSHGDEAGLPFAPLETTNRPAWEQSRLASYKDREYSWPPAVLGGGAAVRSEK